MAFLTRHFVCQFQFPRNAQTTKTTPCSTTDTFFWQKWLPLSLKTNKSFTNPWAWSAHEEIRSRYIYNNLHALGEPNTVAESMVVPAPELCLLTTAATELIHRTLQELKEKEQETTIDAPKDRSFNGKEQSTKKSTENATSALDMLNYLSSMASPRKNTSEEVSFSRKNRIVDINCCGKPTGIIFIRRAASDVDCGAGPDSQVEIAVNKVSDMEAILNSRKSDLKKASNSQVEIAVNAVSGCFEDANSQPENIANDVKVVESLNNISYESAMNMEAILNSRKSYLKKASNVHYTKKKETRSELILPQMDSKLNKDSVMTPTREVHFEKPLPKIQQRRVLSCPDLTKSKLELYGEVQTSDSQIVYSTKKIQRAVNSLDGNSKTSYNSIYSNEYRSMSNNSTENNNLISSKLFSDSKGCQTPFRMRFDEKLIPKLETEKRMLENRLNENVKDFKDLIDQNEDLMLRKKDYKQQIRNQNILICTLRKKIKKLTMKLDYTETTSYRYHKTFRYIEM